MADPRLRVVPLISRSCRLERCFCFSGERHENKPFRVASANARSFSPAIQLRWNVTAEKMAHSRSRFQMGPISTGVGARSADTRAAVASQLECCLPPAYLVLKRDLELSELMNETAQFPWCPRGDSNSHTLASNRYLLSTGRALDFKKTEEQQFD